MRNDRGVEYATTHWPDGTPVTRTEVLESLDAFRRALAQHGGRPPIGRNGKPQVWNRTLGFHDDLRDAADDLARHLSPAARALHDSRRLQARDQGLLADWRAGRRSGSSLVVAEARQREREREIVEDRIRSRSRIA
jgi:hypothetical protein